MKLKEIRKRHGFTQKQVANLLDMTESGYGFYEQGSRAPSVAKLQKLAEEYGVPLDYFTSDQQQGHARTILDVRDDILNGRVLSEVAQPMTDAQRTELAKRIDETVSRWRL